LDSNRPNNAIEYSEHRGDPKKGRTTLVNWDTLCQVFEAWSKLIKAEQSTVLHEDVKQHRNFTSIINTISPMFQVIYNQALKAENNFLSEVCGMAYRKAFEFLLKDFLIYTNKLTKSEANDIFKLQICVDKLKENYIMHKLASYTAYLGNDFSHYYRKWVSKEVSDLKEMIDILVDWIDTTESHNQKLQSIEMKAGEKVKEFIS
jgi:hypothetical protein